VEGNVMFPPKFFNARFSKKAQGKSWSASIFLLF